MGLDDLLGDAGKDFLNRNNNKFCYYFGFVLGGIEGLLYASPPSIFSALLWDYIWFGLAFPTVEYLYLSDALHLSDKGKENLRHGLYGVKGPENTLALAVPHIIVANAIYLAKYALFG